MAVGIKKITESVIEDGRALTYCFSSEDGEDFKNIDNSAIDPGAIFASYNANGCFIRVKRGAGNFDKLNAVKTLSPQSIETSLIADQNVTTVKIADQNVTTAKIADKNVTTVKIADSAVTTAKIADQNITNAKLMGIADDKEDSKRAVSTDKIQNSAIITKKIADQNVTTEKIKDAAVITVKIKDSSITTAKIANSAVTTAKINDSSVITSKIADQAVVNSKIGEEAVTWNKLHNEVVTYIKEEIDRKIRESEEAMRAYIAEATKHMLRHDGEGNVNGENGSSAIKNLKISEDFECTNINATDTIEGRRVYNMTYK